MCTKEPTAPLRLRPPSPTTIGLPGCPAGWATTAEGAGPSERSPAAAGATAAKQTTADVPRSHVLRRPLNVLPSRNKQSSWDPPDRRAPGGGAQTLTSVGDAVQLDGLWQTT